jgi:hypothetical protein
MFQNIHPKVIAAYRSTVRANDKNAEDYSNAYTERAVTRASNTLSKRIKEFHPDLDMQQNIALRTCLQEMDNINTDKES